MGRRRGGRGDGGGGDGDVCARPYLSSAPWLSRTDGGTPWNLPGCDDALCFCCGSVHANGPSNNSSMNERRCRGVGVCPRPLHGAVAVEKWFWGRLARAGAP